MVSNHKRKLSNFPPHEIENEVMISVWTFQMYFRIGSWRVNMQTRLVLLTHLGNGIEFCYLDM